MDWFLKTVYQPHYDRFKDDFGKTIVGFFYDEPETHGDWGTEVPKVLAEKGVDWKQALRRPGSSSSPGEAQAAAKYAYLEALGEAWGRTLYGGMTRWCREHGVISFGHFLEHDARVSGSGQVRRQHDAASEVQRHGGDRRRLQAVRAGQEG